MAESRDTPKSDDKATAPVTPVQRPSKESDTALERAVDFDDDHLPRDTAPLERADLDALRALVDVEAEEPLGGPTDEFEVDALPIDDDDEDPSDDTLNDTVASEVVADEDTDDSDDGDEDEDD